MPERFELILEFFSEFGGGSRVHNLPCCGELVLDFGIFFFFNDTATTEISTLSLHDALPIRAPDQLVELHLHADRQPRREHLARRSEEHTSELPSHLHHVCRLLLETKKT